MPQTDSPESAMPFLHHLEELRWRLLKSFLALIVATIASFYYAEQIMKFITAPLGETKLYFTEVTGSFYAYLKLSLLTGVIAASPVIFYQMWSFVSPGLYNKEKLAVLPLVFVSTSLFVIGAGFCYYAVLPYSLKFLIDFAGDLLSPLITIGSYITFAGMLMLAFGVCFQLPVAAYFLGRIGLISPAFLRKGRPYAVVLILIFAGVLTPSPDVATQLMLAVPLYLLYELSIIIVKITGKEQ
ncbi:MAG: twin-arginine translocase subunit TatC [Candidatus Zixiibacteriota bacterium]